MSGPMSRYRKSLAATPGPIMAADLPAVTVDLRGISAYARERGVQPSELTDDEKARFVRARREPAMAS